MGNVVHCCHTLSNYFKCRDALVQGEPERSPLLSSEESDCDSPSLPEMTEDDLSPGSTNPTLEPENFLFPDIILSSNLGGDVTLVEPMVCLLVSEEEDRTRVDEPREESRRRGSGGCYEVETQTEVETQIVMGVQTQTEFQGHSEILMHHNPNVERELNMLVKTENANEDLCEGQETVKQVETDGKQHTPPELDSMVPVLIPGQNTDFMQQHNSNFTCAGPSAAVETDEGHTDTENFNRRWGQNLVQTKDRNASQRQTAHQIEGPENLHQSNKAGVDNRAGLFNLEDGGSGLKSMALLSLDRLFLTGLHHKTPLSDTVESNKGSPYQCVDQSVHDLSDLQNTTFNVRIQPPGTESFELQISGQMLVAEVHQLLMEHENTCHRTCFSVRLGGVPLDSHTKISSIQGVQEGAVIKMEEELYSVRDAHLHLRHVRDLLRSLDPADAHNGINGSSLSYLSYYTQISKGQFTVFPYQVLSTMCVNNSSNLTFTISDIVSEGGWQASESALADLRPPEYILPGSNYRPLLLLQPVRDDRKPLRCLKVMSMSSWNPPPGNRKMHGDLMYLNVLTMEDKELNITSSTRGFYLNQSTAFNFNPKPAAPKLLCHSLVELLSQVSPAFRKSFNALQKMRVLQHLYERTATPFQVFTWIAPEGDYTLDCVRSEEKHVSHAGQEEHPAGQSRDWNEELQACRELSRNSFQERLHREMKIFKVRPPSCQMQANTSKACFDRKAVTDQQ
ncbi:hypothetical protein fugu_009368 [Takifugu bimaculatus]|uniref:Uncharacterized protein n=1 Tax=Takifugu bimaculatus TaxID=433685 RepID=A0A4Z2B2T3_9TELE|nr:hypothetical protein fugu_009368 [Takifugu bimaculatus]